ncbi:MAG: hypothetical protein LQ343_003035 [Gyalolechia ehrenbergii]|nr:MAG: hypothetical protein LQ343_003035 [Gyalolechia ehrenbergii]
MCHFEVEKFSCGHDEKHKIPCETFCESGSCSKPEDDQIRNNAGPKCNKCKDDEDEADYIQEELRKFAEQESLNPSMTPMVRSRDPNAPQLFFKRCIVWTRCGHHSHSRPSDIERDEGDPEYLHVEGLGNCFDCSAASPSIIAEMKQNGDYEKEDPWGAMSRPEVGEGSSRGVTLPSLEEIGQGVTHDQVKQQARERASDSPPSSPERADDRSKPAASSEPDYDTSLAKGKGRPGRPIHPLSHITTVEDAESDGEDRHPRSSKKSAEPSEFGEEADDNSEFDEESEAEEEETGRHGLHESKKLPGRQPSMSGNEADDQGHFSDDKRAHSKESRRGRARHRDHDDEGGDQFDDLYDASNASSEAEDDDLATPEELKAAGLPGNSEMTKSEVQRHLHRKLVAGKLAMLQHNKNEVE